MRWLMLISVLILVNFGEAIPRTQKSKLKKIICHYNVTSYYRPDHGKFLLNHLDPAVGKCTHLVYGYFGIDPVTYRIKSLHEEVDYPRGNYYIQGVAQLKNQYPYLRTLFGIGGGDDAQFSDVYLNVLLPENRDKFIKHLSNFTLIHNYDGVDLAWQFPRDHLLVLPISDDTNAYHDGGPIPIPSDPKKDFIDFLTELRQEFSSIRKSISVTVLPNMNISKYFDVEAMVNHIDFVTLAAFDFNTPESTPIEADFAHPLDLVDGRNFMFCAKSQINYWLQRRMSATKIILGVPTYGRVWKMTATPTTLAIPPVSYTANSADPGPYTRTPGLMAYGEICADLVNAPSERHRSTPFPLTEVATHPEYGAYAYRFPDLRGQNGVWISYENNETINKKAIYVRDNLGGIAFFDLTNDDFLGICGESFPLLSKAAKLLRVSYLDFWLRDDP